MLSREAAAILGVNRGSVDRYVRVGLLDVIPGMRPRQIDPASVDRMISNRSKICPTCDQPFIAGVRTGTIYCSLRCASLISAYRKYEEISPRRLVERECKRCGKTFSRVAGQGTGPTGRLVFCSEQCSVAHHNDRSTWTLHRRITARRAKILYQYGMEPGDFDRMVIAQCGKCDICSCQMDDPHIDHCHTTGAVRALLCRDCNHGLGRFRDNPEYCRSAAQYLERFAA